MITAQEAKEIADNFLTSEHLKKITEAIKSRAETGYYSYIVSDGLSEGEKKILKGNGFIVNGPNISW